MPDGETRSQATLRTFWEWVETKYSPEEIEVIKRDYTAILQFYVNNIQGTQWDVGMERLPPGRPQPEKYGITENDWETLEMLSGSPQRLQRELEKWVSTGYINQYQARDIWDEVAARGQRRIAEEFIGVPVTTPEERQAEKVEALRRTGRVGIAGIPEWQLEQWEQRVRAGEITEEEVGRYIERREETARKRKRAAVWRYAPPRPEYGRAFEEERAGLGGPQPWRSWFESQYPSLVSRFKATLPRMEQRFYPGLTPREAERQIEETWAERLRKRKPELREEYATRYPYGMGARPWAMAPRIQTVGF